MKRRIITTSDGSKTIQIEDWNEQYHSIHGALQEANHVFITHGLQHFYSKFRSGSPAPVIDILEIGFGTGLNAYLTLLKSDEWKQVINYVGVEAFPVKTEELNQLNYVELTSTDYSEAFYKMHQIPWEISTRIGDYFQLEKQQKLFNDIRATEQFDLIYYDAFGARVQPELWTETLFKPMYEALKSDGVLVTYSAKGSVRRALQAVGFVVERLPGPPGKREMLRACKMS